MNNFFFNNSDYSLFKKALKSTEDEPVVINILSTDSSLQRKEKVVVDKPSQRKSMSQKYEPSPFGRFFGPRKPQNVSVDMKDFSSWKNKNYRKVEEQISDKDYDKPTFSLSDFMSDKSRSKFNELDQARSDLQKPITQLSSDDPTYKKFSLDSYMHKLEEQTRAKDSFEENDDILEPLGTDTQEVVPDSSQDENFGESSNINIEKLAFDDEISGDKFKFEKEELDIFRERLDMIAKEAELAKKAEEEEQDDQAEINISNLVDEDFEELTIEEESSSDDSEVKEESNNDATDDTEETQVDDLLKMFDDEEQDESLEDKTEDDQEVVDDNIDDENISNEDEEALESQENVEEDLEPADVDEEDEIIDEEESEEDEVVEEEDEVDEENEQLRAQLQELIDSNKKLDQEKEESLRQAEIERQRVAAEYESRMKEMEETFKQNYEEFKKQAYLEKIEREMRLKEAETRIKQHATEIVEKEKQTQNKKRAGAMLRKELKSNLNISNLEMDKRLLEVASDIKVDDDKKEEKVVKTTKRKESVSKTVENKEVVKKPTTSKPKRTRKKTSKRKIDSDIIGSIDFE